MRKPNFFYENGVSSNNDSMHFLGFYFGKLTSKLEKYYPITQCDKDCAYPSHTLDTRD